MGLRQPGWDVSEKPTQTIEKTLLGLQSGSEYNIQPLYGLTITIIIMGGITNTLSVFYCTSCV